MSDAETKSDREELDLSPDDENTIDLGDGIDHNPDSKDEMFDALDQMSEGEDLTPEDMPLKPRKSPIHHRHPTAGPKGGGLEDFQDDES